MDARRVIGVDVGGTKILAAILDETGAVGGLRERPTPSESQEELLDALVDTISGLRDPGIEAVGLGVPARIDQRTETAIGSVNTRLHDIRLREVLEDRLGMRVGVINDGSAATLAEFVHGAGRGTRDLVLLTLGTGVGGGFVLGGQLYHGWAEVGHMVIVEDGEPCQGACTGRGHVESYCSGLVADRLARELLGPRCGCARPRRATASCARRDRPSPGRCDLLSREPVRSGRRRSRRRLRRRGRWASPRACTRGDAA